MKKLLEENETLKQIVYDAGRPPKPPGHIHRSITDIFIEKSC